MSDWKRINAMRDTELEQNAHDDQDNPPTDEAMRLFWADAELCAPDPHKVSIHIRIDPSILAFFKKDVRDTRRGSTVFLSSMSNGNKGNAPASTANTLHVH